VVQSASKLEIEFGLRTIRCKLHCEVPENVRIDFVTTLAGNIVIRKLRGVHRELLVTFGQIHVMVLGPGVPRFDPRVTNHGCAIFRVRVWFCSLWHF